MGERSRAAHSSDAADRGARLMRLVSALVLATSLLSSSSAYAAEPREDAEPEPSLNCVRPVQTAAVDNVMEAQWSPDGHTLALVWFSQVPSTRNPHGYREVEVV